MFLFAASMAMLASCSDSDDSVPPVVEPNAALTFELSAVSELQGATRSPVYSQAASQQVTRVSIHAFKNDGTGSYKFKKTYNVTGWTAGTTFKRYEVAANDTVAPGDYKFLAVGRDASDMFTIAAPVVNTTTFESVMATIAASGNESEIFSGSTLATVTPEGGTRISIEMARKVAGILGYFKNIPQMINGTTVQFLRLSVTNSSLGVNLSNGVGMNATGTAYNIINIDLSSQGVTGGIYNGNDLSSQGVVKVAMSQLGGSFFMPVSGVSMILGLYDVNGNALKSWNVMDGSATNMSIMANHFYSLGVKRAVGDTTGGGTPDPGDDDAPIDLLTDQSIVITINPAWDLIHNLIIQPVAPN